MPVDSAHQQYRANAPKWKQMRDCLEGEKAIKAAGTEYLPKLGGQKIRAYEAYKERAMFYGATGRTSQGLLGAVFRKDPEWKLPTRLESLLSNVDLAGTTANNFARRLVEDILGTGRAGVLTDLPALGESRPYLAFYSTESITNWRTRVDNGVVRLAQVILKESVEEPAEDGFGSTTSVRYRVLELDGDGFYQQRIFTKPKTGDWVESDVLQPKSRRIHRDRRA